MQKIYKILEQEQCWQYQRHLTIQNFKNNAYNIGHRSQSKTSRKDLLYNSMRNLCLEISKQYAGLTKFQSCYWSSYLKVAAINSTKTGVQFCMADAKKVVVFSRPTKNNVCSKKHLTTQNSFQWEQTIHILISYIDCIQGPIHAGGQIIWSRFRLIRAEKIEL